MTHPARAKSTNRPISRSLLAIGRALRTGQQSVGHIVDHLGPNGHGLALLLLAIVTLIPVPGPLGVALGLLMACVSLQLMTGASRLWLPAFVRRSPFPTRFVRAAIASVIPRLSRVEGILREKRLAVLTGQPARCALAIPILLLGLVIAAPIPFGNLAPALAVIAIAVGLIARDGAAVMIGLTAWFPAVAWAALVAFFGAEFAGWFISRF